MIYMVSIIDLVIGVLMGLELQVMLTKHITKGKPVTPLSWIVDIFMILEKRKKDKIQLSEQEKEKTKEQTLRIIVQAEAPKSENKTP